MHFFSLVTEVSSDWQMFCALSLEFYGIKDSSVLLSHCSMFIVLRCTQNDARTRIKKSRAFENSHDFKERKIVCMQVQMILLPNDFHFSFPRKTR